MNITVVIVLVVKYVRIMNYEPRNPFHLRYQCDFNPGTERLKQMEEIVIKLNESFGLRF